MPTATLPTTYRFTVDQYHRMIRAAVLAEGAGVELINGQVVLKGEWRDGGPVLYRFRPDQCLEMARLGILSEDDAFALAELGGVAPMPRSPAHDSAIDRVDDAIRPLLTVPWRLRIQSAIRLPGGEPEPDLAVVLGPAGRYDHNHPEPTEIALVIEVADSSLAYDRALKLQAYAAAGIPVYWIVNLDDRQVEVYELPVSPSGHTARYQSRTDYRPAQSLPLNILGTVVGQCAVDSLLP
jgi:hypothetical protein